MSIHRTRVANANKMTTILQGCSVFLIFVYTIIDKYINFNIISFKSSINNSKDITLPSTQLDNYSYIPMLAAAVSYRFRFAAIFILQCFHFSIKLHAI